MFGVDSSEIEEIEQLTEHARNSKGKFIGSFKLSDSKWFHGTMVDGEIEGLGLLHEVGGKTQVGIFKKGQLSGFGRIIWPNGIVMDGFVENSKIEG